MVARGKGGVRKRKRRGLRDACLVAVIPWSGPMLGKLDKNLVDYNTARRFSDDIVVVKVVFTVPLKS